MEHYTIGLDYGTLSVRAVLVSVDTGKVLAQSVYEYPHGVMEQALPEGEPLPEKFALEDPADYRSGLIETVRSVLAQSGVPAERVAGIGIDSNGASVLPILKDGTPLCSLPEFRHEKHAYMKLWKHHGAEEEAKRIEELAEARGESWLPFYGGRISCELAIPKIWETLRRAPEVYRKADAFTEAADWITMLLTGEPVRSTCTMGYKYFYRPDTKSFPSDDFFASLDPELAGLAEEKLWGRIVTAGECAGGLCPEMAEILGLVPGTPVAASLLDAHASVLGSGVCRSGEAVSVVGTSACHLILSERSDGIAGAAGTVYHGIVKGLYGIESGQSCVGDGFACFTGQFVPKEYTEEGQARGMDIHALLTEKAAALQPGRSGLLALDWMNGVRSPLADFSLSGALMGLTLQTKPEEIYLALLEASAYGTRWILEQYEKAGIPVRSVVLCGGIPLKNTRLAQIYADVLHRPVRVAGSPQACALGAAISGALAAGREGGGFSEIEEAVRVLGAGTAASYQPTEQRASVYEQLYGLYRELGDLMVQKESPMRQLRAIKESAQREQG